MAKTSYLIVPDGFVDQYYGAVSSKERFQYSRVVHINRLLSYKARKKVRARSLLPALRTAWFNLSSGDRLAWNSAGAVCGRTGYALFIQDTTRRGQSEISGVATPSMLHQSLVGEILCTSSNDQAKLIQQHPQNYWISQKVVGKQKVYQPVKVTENFALPLVLTISYHTDLVASGTDSYCRFYAVVKSLYQGRTLQTHATIEIPLVSDWQSDTVTISSVVGVVTGYDLFLEVYKAMGSFQFDTVKAVHSGVNWVRDPFCDDIHQGFTKAFFQVAKHWAPVILTDGADYGSVYPDTTKCLYDFVVTNDFLSIVDVNGDRVIHESTFPPGIPCLCDFVMLDDFSFVLTAGGDKVIHE